jgi:hypothetical protein
MSLAGAEPMATSLPRQLVLKRDALEVFAVMSDSIFGLLVSTGRHAPCNGVGAACRTELAVSRSIVDDFADLKLVWAW